MDVIAFSLSSLAAVQANAGGADAGGMGADAGGTGADADVNADVTGGTSTSTCVSISLIGSPMLSIIVTIEDI